MPASDTAEKDSPVSGAAATISQLFSTPLVRVTYPYADEVSAPLAARILERGQGCPGPVKDFGYKTETSGELTRCQDLEEEFGAAAVEFHAAEFVDLCRDPHRSIYAETATLPSRLAAHEAIALAGAVLVCIVAVSERVQGDLR
ncbi:hypothetical protein [Streptomyces niveus]